MDDLAPGGFDCASCGTRHADVPLSFHVPSPVVWTRKLAKANGSHLEDEVCIIRNEQFFIRGLVVIPITGHDAEFEYGVWVSLRAENFYRLVNAWEKVGRETLLPPMFGWLAVALPGYAVPTVDLKTMVHTQPVGYRPLIELEPTAHALAVEQRTGISWDDATRKAGLLLSGT